MRASLLPLLMSAPNTPLGEPSETCILESSLAQLRTFCAMDLEAMRERVLTDFFKSNRAKLEKPGLYEMLMGFMHAVDWQEVRFVERAPTGDCASILTHSPIPWVAAVSSAFACSRGSLVLLRSTALCWRL